MRILLFVGLSVLLGLFVGEIANWCLGLGAWALTVVAIACGNTLGAMVLVCGSRRRLGPEGNRIDCGYCELCRIPRRSSRYTRNWRLSQRI
jgi:hypothetical protein